MLPLVIVQSHLILQHRGLAARPLRLLHVLLSLLALLRGELPRAAHRTCQRIGKNARDQLPLAHLGASGGGRHLQLASESRIERAQTILQRNAEWIGHHRPPDMYAFNPPSAAPMSIEPRG